MKIVTPHPRNGLQSRLEIPGEARCVEQRRGFPCGNQMLAHGGKAVPILRHFGRQAAKPL